MDSIRPLTILRRSVVEPTIKEEHESHESHESRESLTRKLSRLSDENQALRQTNQKLLARLEQQNLKTNLGDTVLRLLKRMKGRIGLVLGLFRFLQEGPYTSHPVASISPHVRPSFLKQIIELVCHQSTVLQDIEICFTSNPTSDTEKVFDHLKHYFELCLSIAKEFRISCIPSFEGYVLVKYHLRSTHDLELTFLKDNDLVLVRLMLYAFDMGESSNQMMILSPSGIHSLHPKISTISCLEQLYFKEHYFLTNPEDLQRAAFPLTGCLPYELKKKHLLELYQLIGDKMFRQLQDGYHLSGTVPVWRIEGLVDCPITAVHPPYHVFELQCGHWISTMAYCGIITTPNHFSEALRCPQCRQNLEIKFVSHPITRPEIKGIKIKKNLVA